MKLIKCKKCGDAWVYSSIGDYGSGYESHGYKVECACPHSFLKINWKKTKDEAIDAWNKVIMEEAIKA